MPAPAPEPASPSAGGGEEAVEAASLALARDGRLHGPSDRLSGWAMDVPDAPGTTAVVMERRDGANPRVREISQLLEGRTHIEEHNSRAAWRTWGPAPMESDG